MSKGRMQVAQSVRDFEMDSRKPKNQFHVEILRDRTDAVKLDYIINPPPFSSPVLPLSTILGQNFRDKRKPRKWRSTSVDLRVVCHGMVFKNGPRVFSLVLSTRIPPVKFTSKNASDSGLPTISEVSLLNTETGKFIPFVPYTRLPAPHYSENNTRLQSTPFIITSSMFRCGDIIIDKIYLEIQNPAS
jgi:hypothetical protein